MDYAILAMMSPVLFFYGVDTFMTFRDFKLKNINNIKRVNGFQNPYENIDLSKVKNEELRAYINNFSNVVITNFDHDDLVNFYINVNSYKTDEVIKKRLSLFFMGVTASYNTDKNEIEFGMRAMYNCIYHELFHMASSKSDGKYCSSGFNYIDNKSKFNSAGVGINEGYTQFLAQRYFDESDYVSNSYQYMVVISKFLEYIIGKNKMQSLYMQADLLGLIDELKLYKTEDEIMRFITDTDFIVRNFPLRDTSLVPTKEFKIKSSIGRIDDFLIDVYSQKNGWGNYKKQELSKDIFDETNILLPRNYRRSFY